MNRDSIDHDKRLRVRRWLAAIALAACLGFAAAQQIEASGVLRVLGFGTGDEIATVRVDRFHELYPDIELQHTEGAVNQQQLLTAIVSGNPPDVVYLNRDDLTTYASRGALQPVDQCIEDAGIDMSQFRSAASQERANIRAEAGTTYTGTYTGNLLADERIFGELVQPSGNEAFDHGVEVILEVQDASFSIPANPAGAEVRQAWIDAVNRVLNGEQTAEDALSQAQEEAQAALDEAWEQ